jgi:Xaa-Pro aminopeptidase
VNRERLYNLRNKLKPNKLDALLITNPINIFYLSGFTGSNGCIIITNDRAFLITDFRYTQQASEEALEYEIVEYKNTSIDSINNILTQYKLFSLGFEEEHIKYVEFMKLNEKLLIKNFIPTRNLVENIRRIKSEDEILRIKKAAHISDLAFSSVVKNIKHDITEIEIANDIEFYIKRNGGTKMSFDTIVASGERSSLPHGQPTNKKIEHGDFVTLDFGCIYENYCSDMTRTIIIGEAQKKQIEIYNIVLKAQIASIKAITSGQSGETIDKIGRDIIAHYGYGKHFGHGLGHGVGLEIHEAPRLSASGKDILEPGMIVTAEPGIYIKGFGGVRIEDLLVVTENGSINLTSSNKELMII